MTMHLSSAPIVSITKIATLINAGNGAGGAAPGIPHSSVQWGQANGCTFRFDTQALPRRSSAASVPPGARRGVLLSARQAAAARRGGGRVGITSLAAEFGLDYDYDDVADDASISGTSPAQSASYQGHGAHEGQARQDDHDTHEEHGQGNNAGRPATFEFAPSASLKGQTNSSFNGNPSVFPTLLELALTLTSDTSLLSLRQRALATSSTAAAVPVLESVGMLGHVRTALVDAVNAGTLVPRAEPGSPDQNCLLPLLLLRALRPMSPALRAQASARSSAMLSMSRRMCATRVNVRNQTIAP